MFEFDKGTKNEEGERVALHTHLNRWDLSRVMAVTTLDSLPVAYL